MLSRRIAELDAGADPLGWKIGINVPAVQERLGIDAPVAGYLTTASQLEPGSEVDVSGLENAVLEPELAIRVGPGGAVAASAPAIELVDIDLPFDEIEPILAGNVFHSGVCFGPETEGPAPSEVRCRVLVDGAEVATGMLAEPPEATVAHVDRLLAAHGARLQPGDRIIAGSITPPLPLEPPCEVTVELGELGSVSLRFR